MRDAVFFKVKPQPPRFPNIDNTFLCPLCQIVILRAKIILKTQKLSRFHSSANSCTFFFFFLNFKVTPQPPCFPYIDNTFLCPLCQIVILRAKIILKTQKLSRFHSSANSCTFFFFFLNFKVTPQPPCFPYIDSRFLCPVCQVLILTAKIILKPKSSLDFTAVRICALFLCQLTCQSADIMSSLCGVGVRIRVNNFFSKTTRPRDMLFFLKDTLSIEDEKLFKACKSVCLFARDITRGVPPPKV